MPPALRPVPDRPPRAILYLRQSIARDDSVSLELQETAGRDYCARMGYEVADVVADPGRTGRTLKRRQVLDTIGRIERREADLIVVWRWSRLARSRRDFAVVCDQVEALGGRIESAMEPIDVRTPSGRLARGMMAEVAAWESEQRGEVWREVHARRRTNGVPAQGGRRFGYLRDGDQYRPDPETAPILAAMYRRYLAGDGFVSIAAWLNRDGIRTLAGGTWTRDRVTHVLDSGFGAGQIRYAKRKGRNYVPGAHDSLITAEEWQRYLMARQTRTTSPVPPDPVYMLAGLIRCGDCQSPMHSTRLGVRAGYGYWCSKWSQGRACRCVTVTRHKAEAAVFAFLEELASDTSDEAKRATLARAAKVTARSEVEDIARRITRLDERLTRLTIAWSDSQVPDTQYHAAVRETQDIKARLTRELVVAEQRAAAVPDRPSVSSDLLRQWPRMRADEQRRLLGAFVDRVLVHRPHEAPRRGGQSRVTVEVVSTWGDSFTYGP